MKYQLSRRKRLFFIILSLCFSYGIAEICSAIFLHYRHNGIGTTLANRDMATEIDESHKPAVDPLDVIHPYIGFVRTPNPSPGELHVNPYGFADNSGPFHKRSPGKLIVAITGGSFAEQFMESAREKLASELKKIEDYRNREIIFVRLALQGHKQPQQLMAINFLYTLGAEFDILINIDGFNEVALPVAENAFYSVFPSYPRMWHTKVTNIYKPRLSRLIGHITHIKYEQRKSAEFFASIPLRYSLTLTAIWAARHESRKALISKELVRLTTISQDELTFGAAGPKLEFRDKDELYAHCVSVWSRSSQLLHHICNAHGTRYFHFLQPNQYSPIKKPMGPQQKKKVFNPHEKYAAPATDGYPLLMAEGAILREKGIRFHDLTDVYSDHPEDIYADNCCHANKHGYEIVAQRIGKTIGKRDE